MQRKPREFSEGDVEQSIAVRFERQVEEYPDRIAVKTADHALTYQALNNASNRTDTSTIHDLLRARAEQDGQAVAIVSPGRTPLTYQNLLCHVDCTIGSLRSCGITRHDRIAIVLPAGPELATAFLAVASVAAAIPLNPAYREQEFDVYFADCGPKALIVTASTDGAATRAARKRGIDVIHVESRLDAPAGVFTLNTSTKTSDDARHDGGCDDTALLLCTSGTTSRPKRVPLTHKNLLTAAANIAASLKLDATDRCLDLMPLFHIHGLVGGLLSSLSASASVAIPPAFESSNFFAWLEELKPTWYTAVPTMHQAISRGVAERDGKVDHALRFIRSCSAALSPKLMAETEAIFGVPVIEAYGMTEASHQMASNPLPPLKRKAGSVGTPTCTQVAIMDEGGNLKPKGAIGEIVVRGENVTTGYEQDSAANQSAFTDGWFRTGDQGYFDTDGYLFLTGRLKELINRGGAKIAPLEIEAVLLDHGAVSEAAVFAVSHSTLGEDVGAAVVLKSERTVTASELQQFVATRLADFKIPRQIVFVQQIPKGGTGKVRRRDLASQLGLDAVATETRREYAEPRTDLEAKVADIWCSVLRLDKIDIHDSFFSLGGDSITAALLMVQIEKTFGRQLLPAAIFGAPTIERLASLLRAKEDDPGLPSIVPIQPHGSCTPFFWIHGDWSNALLPKFLGPDQPLYGLEHQGQDGKAAEYKSVEAIAEHYLRQIRSVQHQGPYLLGGYSTGGVVAFELAQRLRQRRETVSLLVMLDSTFPGATTSSSELHERSEAVSSDSPHSGWTISHLQKLAQLGPRDQVAYVLVGIKNRMNAAIGDRIAWMFKSLLCRVYVSLGWVLPPFVRSFYIQGIYKVALQEYAPQPFAGRAVYFRSLGRSRRSLENWKNLMTDGLEIYEVPGDHRTIITTEGAHVWAELLKVCIANAQRSDSEAMTESRGPMLSGASLVI